MTTAFNVYCDESCHLQNDQQNAMVLGAVWCPRDEVPRIHKRLREIKTSHGLAADFETKWNKVSPAKLDFYLSVLDYFFDDDDLHFRALIVPDKTELRHEEFAQSHDDWYYKMYFDMLKVILTPDSYYCIYLDIKDTRGGQKVAKLHDVLCNNLWDFSREIIHRVQIVRSHEVGLVQLADLLIGAVSYANRAQSASNAKTLLVERMRKRSGYSLLRTTLIREDKVNLFVWRAS